MAEEIVAKYKVDVTEASKALTGLANTAKKTEDAMAKSAKAATDSFVAGSGGAKSFEIAMKSNVNTIAQLDERLKALKSILLEDAKIGSQGFKQISAAIVDTQFQIDKASGKLGSVSAKVKQAIRESAIETEKAKKKQDEYNKSLEKVPSLGSNIISTFKNVATAIGIAFGVQQLISFGKEAVQLAAKAEGVKRAFDRIGDASLLDGLRAATRGTVTDLVLMQNAVKASNFKIPLEQLGTLFQFAQTRARATGESVDYLVDSLILGIGRKSIPILDNLGISAVELKEKLGDTAKSAATIGDVAEAVGRIATESLEKTGREADTTADRLARLATIWNNFKTDSGGAIVDVATRLAQLFELIPEDVQKTNDFVESLTNKSVLALDKIGKAQLKAVQAAREAFNAAQNTPFDQLKEGEADRLQKELFVQLDLLKVIQETYKTRLAEVRAGSDLNAVTADQLDLLKKIQEEQQANDGQIKNVYYYTEAIKDLNEKINAQGTAEADIMPLIKERALLQVELTKLTTEQATGTALLNQQLSELKKELDSAEIGGSKFWATLDKITDKTKELWEAQAMMKFNDDTIDLDPEMWQLPIDKELDALYKANQEKLRMNKELNAETKAINDKAFDEAIARIEAEISAKKEQKEKELMIAEEFGQYAMQLSSLISQAQQVATENELAVLQSALDAGQITREEYDAKRRELLNDQAKQDKEISIFEATIAAFLATIKAYSDGGPIAAAIAAAFGIAQVALIAAQPIPQFAEGGWVDSKGKIHGRKHAQGGVKIETEGDEFIVKGVMANRHPDIVEAVNQGTIMKLIKDSYVTPAVNAALLNGFSDIGTSAQLNGLTAKLSDHNIIAAMDRNRSATVYGLKMLADKMDKRQPKRGGYA